MSNELEKIPTAEVAIVKRDNIQKIVYSAPDSYNINVTSTQNCMAACQALLDEINAHGMTDALDQKAAKYIDKTRRTVKEMNERRSPYTKLFDQIRSEFTKLENAIDPSKAGTVPYQLQQLRDAYARKKREEEETRRRAEEARRAAEAARNTYRAACDEDYQKSYNALVTDTINQLTELNSSVTLDSYKAVYDTLTGFSVELPAEWCPASSVRIPYNLSADEAKVIRGQSLNALLPRFAEQYKFEVEEYRNELLDKLPSKKAELERMAQASAAEAAQIKAEIAKREAEEAERKEKERREKEEADRVKAEMEKQNAEVQSLFNQVAPADYTPKTKVTKKLRITSPSAFLAIVSLWWQNEGCDLTVDELSKTFKKQITFCEKVANKDGVFITDTPGLEYVEDVKAR